jgi:hypothetical protein
VRKSKPATARANKLVSPEVPSKLGAQGTPGSLTADHWSSLLSAELRTPVDVRYTQARRSVLRVQRTRGVFHVRMQRFFSEAPPEVRQHLLTWMRLGRRAPAATRQLDAWIDERLAELWREDPRKPPLTTRSHAHDLEPLARELLASEFGADFPPGAEVPAVTWGRSGTSRTRHSLRLGSYDYHSGVVRIHPVLDQPAVPAWFVRYVLFHELLHAALPPRKRASNHPSSPTGHTGERRVFHSPEFRRREQLFSDTPRALAWEKQHIRGLISSARTGKPLAGVRAPARPPSRGRPAHGRVSKRRRLGAWVQRLLFRTSAPCP